MKVIINFVPKIYKIELMKRFLLVSLSSVYCMLLCATNWYVATSGDDAATLASATSGRGSMSVKLHGYRDCPLELGATAARRSVDPLDTSKYILAARSALEGGIFDLE